MEYGRYWDGREDPSGEHFNYGRSGNLVPYGIVNSRLEEADLYRMAIRQGFTLETRSLDPEMTYPAQVFVRERGSSRRVTRSRRGEVEMASEFVMPGFKYQWDHLSRYGHTWPETGNWGVHNGGSFPMKIHDRLTGEIHTRMATYHSAGYQSWFQISWQGKRIDLDDLLAENLPEAPSQRCACRAAPKRRTPSKRARR